MTFETENQKKAIQRWIRLAIQLNGAAESGQWYRFLDRNCHSLRFYFDAWRKPLAMNRERPDFAVRLLWERLRELFELHGSVDDLTRSSLGAAFLKPIFDLARPCPQAPIVLELLRRRGLKTALSAKYQRRAA